MKIGHRFTIAIVLVFVSIVAIYSLFDFHKSSLARRQNLREKARDVALALRSAVELNGLPIAQNDADTIAKALTHSNAPWDVRIFSAVYLQQAESTPQILRAREILKANGRGVLSEGNHEIRFLLPLRSLSSDNAEPNTFPGTLELAHSTSELEEADRSQQTQIAIMLAALFILVTGAVLVLSRILISKPIYKLLDGVGDVAQGDLSRVLLAEREDEIGALASRFNAMTQSLRQSRGEALKQDQARARLESRLFQTEKLATIGQIAAEIAHEVGTPLNVIAGRARTMEKKSHDQAAVEKNAGIIAEQAGRITRIIQRLLDFSRRKVGSVETLAVNLNDIVQTTATFLEGKLHAASISYTLDLADASTEVTGNADELQQVLLNLMINAAEAMPQGGKLRVSTRVSHRRRLGLENAPEQPFVEVEVIDTGPGIPREKRERVFEPFYSTKQSAGGTGLGLAVVFGIVKEHDGWVEILDHVPTGAVVRICLPSV